MSWVAGREQQQLLPELLAENPVLFYLALMVTAGGGDGVHQAWSQPPGDPRQTFLGTNGQANASINIPNIGALAGKQTSSSEAGVVEDVEDQKAIDIDAILRGNAGNSTTKEDIDIDAILKGSEDEEGTR